jgi:hypothetical protein
LVRLGGIGRYQGGDRGFKNLFVDLVGYARFEPRHTGLK